MEEKSLISQTQSPQDFNWNDLNVGNYQLDHSENFFATKHITHEKPLFVGNLENTLENKENVGVKNDAQVDHNVSASKGITLNLLKLKVENVQVENSEPKLEVKMPNLYNNSDVDLKCFIKNELQHKKSDAASHITHAATDAVTTTIPSVSASASDIGMDCSIKKELQQKQNENITFTNAADANADANPVPTSNIILEWSIKNEAQNNINQNLMTFHPQAFEYQKIYQLKKKETLRKIEQEERKQREFRSKPKPNFNEYHRRINEQRPIHKITIPFTPEVLKHSKEMERKKFQKLELLKKQLQPSKIEHRPLNVLKEPPFIPKQRISAAVQPVPFKLCLEQRLQERKKYNELVQKFNDEKQRQLQNVVKEKKKREEEEAKQFRKMATFKARPNPFKRE